MFTKLDKFKATAWEKAGKYDAGHHRRVLLAVLIGTGTIAWFLLKFIWAILAAIPDEQTSETEEKKDFQGRKPGDLFYGDAATDLMIMADMEKCAKRD